MNRSYAFVYRFNSRAHLRGETCKVCVEKWQERNEDEEKDGQDGGKGGNLGEEIEIAGFRRNAGLVGRDRIARIRDGACSRAKINRIFRINAYLRAFKWYRVFSTKGTGQVPFLDAPGISLQSLSRVTHLLAYPPSGCGRCTRPWHYSADIPRAK